MLKHEYTLNLLVFTPTFLSHIACNSKASVMFYFWSQVAAKALETAVFGAYYNVTINLKDITDEAFRAAVSVSMRFFNAAVDLLCS